MYGKHMAGLEAPLLGIPLPTAAKNNKVSGHSLHTGVTLAL